MSCFKPNKTLCDCDTTVLLTVYIFLVFVGEGWLELVPSCLPQLEVLLLAGCDNVCEKYVKKLLAAVPELEVRGKTIHNYGTEVGCRYGKYLLSN
jgi:hypothetical protein